jgi:hypothetical protein
MAAAGVAASRQAIKNALCRSFFLSFQALEVAGMALVPACGSRFQV